MEACGFENSRSLLVAGLALRSGVLAPVNLDNQTRRVRVEVEHVRAKGVLAPSLDAGLARAQTAP